LAGVTVLDESHDRLVEDFLDSCDQATIYHTPAWRRGVIDTYGYKPLYLGYLDGDRLSAILPFMLVRSWLTGTRLVSLPFSNVCGPIGEDGKCRLLVEEALGMHSDVGAGAIEIRTQSNLNPVRDERMTDVSYFITSIVKLDPDPDRVWKSFKDRNVRTEVRQAIKKGVEVRHGTGEEDLRAFYDLFASTRLGHGVPPQPYKFFANLWRNMAPKYLDLFLATHGDRCVGALITLRFGKTLNAAYIGSNISYRSHRVHQILFWRAMEMGCARGCEAFDFLRTPRTSKTLRYFKERWNAFEVDLNYLYYPEIRGTASTIEDSAKYKMMTKVLTRAPLFFGKALGRLLYRHLG
jgi:CelD/BcsL family acetyltransferase involved in cellulose biosynthesis